MVTHPLPTFSASGFGIVRRVPDLGFDAAIDRVREVLSEQGFGVLSDLDLQQILKSKLDAGIRRYRVLGACNPQLALSALEHAPGIGLLLPCNVVVAEDADGGTVVAAVDPVALFGVVGDPEVRPIAEDVRDRLERALNAM